jgi:hypothetical protein
LNFLFKFAFLIDVRNRAASVVYSLAGLHIPPTFLVNIPGLLDYARFCPAIVSNNVTAYSQYWDINVCGRVESQADVDSVRSALLDLWQRKYPEINSICFCLNVDIFRDMTQFYTTGSQPVTHMFYLVYANAFRRIFEKSSVTDPSKIPSNEELSQALQLAGFQSCQSQILPIMFSLTVCGPLVKWQLPVILKLLQASWQADPSHGGLGLASQVLIAYQSQQEFISEDS